MIIHVHSIVEPAHHPLHAGPARRRRQYPPVGRARIPPWAPKAPAPPNHGPKSRPGGAGAADRVQKAAGMAASGGGGGGGGIATAGADTTA